MNEPTTPDPTPATPQRNSPWFLHRAQVAGGCGAGERRAVGHEDECLRCRGQQFLPLPPQRRESCTQQIQRGVHAACVDGNLGELEPHLHPCESPGQCQVIEMAEVADPERASRELAQAST
jgi:hypothetical protein